MTIKRKLYLVLVLTLVPALASALGLGRLDLKSALNEPFEARIELLSPTADELDSLDVRLADNDAFARAKVDRPFILSALKFALRRSVDDSPDYIRVYSSEPIREPFLNFLVEVSWSNGRLYREYTVLLDPPLYDPNIRANEFKQQAEISAPVSTIEDPDHMVVGSDAFEKFSGTAPVTSPVTRSTPQIDYSGGDYGPVESGETLWSIASAMRPDSSISVNQMMLALLRTNPDAFINNNINGLKRGQILRMPSEGEINALSNAQALAEAQSQYAVWNDIKDSISTAVEERPEVSSVPEPAEPEPETETVSEPQEIVDTDPELKLVAADDTDDVTEQAASVEGDGGQELILAQETITALTQENLELKDQLQESEAILDDLKRLLSLKDDELAALQEQLAAAKMAEESMEEEPVEEIMEEVEEIIEEDTAEVIAEDMAETEEMVEEVMEEEPAEEAMEEVEEVIEEVEEIVETEPESDAGIMGMVSQYLGQAKDLVMSVKDMVMGNMMVALAAIGVLVVLIVIVVIMKFRKGSAEVMHIDPATEEAFPDFDSDDLGDLGETADDDLDSEAATELPGSEDETYLPGGESEDAAGDEEKTQFLAADETPADAPVAEEPEEEEEDEDPLQEVNTYLAFEQFDQAEEMVRNAINDDPDNVEYHTKLLEVFYTSGNKKAYEEEAKVLHDKVGGEGEEWNMATVMWQEMSPNRALFEEGADEEDDDDDSDTTGGFVDVTADDEAGDSDGGGLDFDIGGSEEASDESPDTSGTDESDDVLDISEGDSGDDDLLDVTAAASLEEEALPEPTADSEEVFDVSGTGGEDLLDVTAATSVDEESSDEDVLDISNTGGEDLLDVTAAASVDLDSDEDLLDVTAATSVDEEDVLDIETDESATEETEESESIEFDVSGSDEASGEDKSLDFDIGATDEAASSESDDEMSLDMDLPSEPEDDAASLDLDMGDAAAEDSDTGTEDDEISLDMDLPSESEEVATEDSDTGTGDDISLDMDISTDDDAGDIELDLSEVDVDDASAESEADLDLSMDASSDDEGASDTGEADGLDFDIGLEDDAAPADGEMSIDMDETVEIPKGSLDLSAGDDDDEDDDDHTVFVPRSSEPDAQSEEDEVATKLDLAKAYVELGDTDSAKTILDEVMAEGNEEQKKQAQELLDQT